MLNLKDNILIDILLRENFPDMLSEQCYTFLEISDSYKQVGLAQNKEKLRFIKAMLNFKDNLHVDILLQENFSDISE